MDAMKPDFIEAAIYIASEGEQAGRYVATCAKNLCGYACKSGFALRQRWMFSHLYKSASRKTLQQDSAHKELCLSRLVRPAHIESLSNPY